MTIEINIPNIGEDELEVTEVMVKIGDNINANQPLIVIEGDKSSMEIPSSCSGIVTKIYAHVGDKVRTGSSILLLDVQNNTNTFTINDKKNVVPSPDVVTNNDKRKEVICNDVHHDVAIHATPLVRHMARTFGIDLSKVKGSGRKGRILKEDIQNHINDISMYYTNRMSSIQSNQLLPILSWPKIDFSKFGDITTVMLSKIQKTSGANLQRNWIMLPHVTQFDEADITDLESFRKQQNIDIEKKKINCKITLLVFVMKAVAKALEELPRFNSSLSQDGETLILKKYINIGIAVDTPKGLLVPVLHDVNMKGIILLSQELEELSKKARTGNQLTPTNMQGGSFTISNLGGIGGTAFTPIVNVPEVAILGMSKSFIKPVWTGKKFTPRLMLPLSLSYDHRVIDGADGARFMTLINKIIADTRLLSM
ncbi:dihydrolipoyllysine-residue acetyltransferase [Candidatus Blochmanniella camponoti]|uniref:Acetyltransferase component of pyruvate dehydrogenase complex n=1 Tax=Candidatus Blochmanniella camponoti TaxID=108080 RepID=A0AAE9ID40_9ENTR|nr:dihydrolipoyllysine-residue acetyltransferase [Candidatus Blochmannia herculeanus]URJ24589.1 dihydrolipoyllysine-residue acetyltransferase [Candidatus Blochmannia herculeanus]URJ26804.1 dihydrolipoyllysine-residue acetyltransferase [Candidatus Blochmannia herculeanus]URJ27392.1 dihydrolipoyllysine-residue acetyltransferase [Candidatus Blochmannia herculeanus]